eukprot:7018601-Pyramimonas_sp.AAC.1
MKLSISQVGTNARNAIWLSYTSENFALSTPVRFICPHKARKEDTFLTHICKDESSDAWSSEAGSDLSEAIRASMSSYTRLQYRVWCFQLMPKNSSSVAPASKKSLHSDSAVEHMFRRFGPVLPPGGFAGGASGVCCVFFPRPAVCLRPG